MQIKEKGAGFSAPFLFARTFGGCAGRVGKALDSFCTDWYIYI
ncbi:hypothetical protein MICA_33 [Micavibrio aeruginosavorus ARL-13]|uniref:Uncharacterized protein n=1 Tax=Micavibrio aeruginosavorus (strain ARL-13) TaxID=856793 RepID=G2KLE5_MICAA|nr:hypothetical protein MICA_33 [Micavibrio aeruginosavorus ARL-13]